MSNAKCTVNPRILWKKLCLHVAFFSPFLLAVPLISLTYFNIMCKHLHWLLRNPFFNGLKNATCKCTLRKPNKVTAWVHLHVTLMVCSHWSRHIARLIEMDYIEFYEGVQTAARQYHGCHWLRYLIGLVIGLGVVQCVHTKACVQCQRLRQRWTLYP